MLVGDRKGRSALHIAAARGHVSCLSELLTVACAESSIPPLKDRHGYTPLHWACYNGQSSTTPPGIKCLLVTVVGSAPPVTKNANIYTFREDKSCVFVYVQVMRTVWRCCWSRRAVDALMGTPSLLCTVLCTSSVLLLLPFLCTRNANDSILASRNLLTANEFKIFHHASALKFHVFLSV